MKDRIRDVVAQIATPGGLGELRDGTSFLESGILDSTGIVELVGHLEQGFAIEIADEEMVPENLDSVDRVWAYLQRKLGSRGTQTQAGAGD